MAEKVSEINKKQKKDFGYYITITITTIVFAVLIILIINEIFKLLPIEDNAYVITIYGTFIIALISIYSSLLTNFVNTHNNKKQLVQTRKIQYMNLLIGKREEAILELREELTKISSKISDFDEKNLYFLFNITHKNYFGMLPLEIRNKINEILDNELELIDKLSFMYYSDAIELSNINSDNQILKDRVVENEKTVISICENKNGIEINNKILEIIDIVDDEKIIEMSMKEFDI